MSKQVQSETLREPWSAMMLFPRPSSPIKELPHSTQLDQASPAQRLASQHAPLIEARGGHWTQLPFSEGGDVLKFREMDFILPHAMETFGENYDKIDSIEEAFKTDLFCPL